MDLGLEALRPAAVAAQPRSLLVRSAEVALGGAAATRLQVVLLRGSVLLGLGHGYPPIWHIVRGGCRNPGSFTWCLSSLRQTASRMICRELRVVGAVAQRAAQVGLVDAEQAGAQLALGGQADAVAVAAERLGDRVDEADLAGAVGEAAARAVRVALARPSGSSG